MVEENCIVDNDEEFSQRQMEGSRLNQAMAGEEGGVGQETGQEDPENIWMKWQVYIGMRSWVVGSEAQSRAWMQLGWWAGWKGWEKSQVLNEPCPGFFGT